MNCGPTSHTDNCGEATNDFALVFDAFILTLLSSARGQQPFLVVAAEHLHSQIEGRAGTRPGDDRSTTPAGCSVKVASVTRRPAAEFTEPSRKRFPAGAVFAFVPRGGGTQRDWPPFSVPFSPYSAGILRRSSLSPHPRKERGREGNRRGTQGRR
ncbi:hypothetical protein MRX96_027280 [Rhipicephalus microplus]